MGKLLEKPGQTARTSQTQTLHLDWSSLVSHLLVHALSVSGTATWQCQQCQRTSTRPERRKPHSETVHAPDILA